ncbi:MAG TPA: choice-of-anchor V domain-containing protein, partial [Thermoplasmata archaeon]|nr:choice-of-anchor V domain-containing protein [Thermoplasmata archaeon]
EAFTKGCYCHGEKPTSTVSAYLYGLPDHYEPGRNYTLRIGVLGGPPASKDPVKNKGGFLIGATAGKFALPSDPFLADDVKVSEENVPAGTNEVPMALITQARQTDQGALWRNWTVDWIAPDPAVGDVIFALYVNAVNGNADGKGGGSTGDQWNYATFASRGEGGFKQDPAEVAYGQAAIMMGAVGIILTVMFSFLGYALIARGTGSKRPMGRKSSG